MWFQSLGALAFNTAGTGGINLWGGGITVPQYADAGDTLAQGAVTISVPIILKANQTWTNSAATPLSISGSIAGGAYALTVAGPGETILSNNITGSGLTEIGGGILILGGTNNTYTGGTTVNASTLVATNSGALPTGTLSVLNGGMLTLNAGTNAATSWTATNISALLTNTGSGFAAGSTLGIDTTLAGTSGFTYGVIGGSMGLAKLGANTLTLTGASTFTGPITISSGTLQLGDGSGHNGSLANANVITDNASLAFNNTGSQTFSDIINGTGNLIQNGTNTLTLQGANSFSGLTTINSGTLQLGNASALQQSTLNTSSTGGSLSFGTTSCTLGGLSGSGTLALSNTGSAAVALSVGNNNGSTTYSGTLSGPGSLTKLGNGNLILTGSNTYAGGTTISGGALQLGNGISGQDGSLSATGGVADNATLVYDLNGSQTYAGVISGSGNLTKSGSGVLTLGGANTFSGMTAITGGTLNLSSGSALQASTVAPTSGKLVFSSSVTSNAFTLGGLSGSGNIGLQNNAGTAIALTVGGNNANTTYSGVLSSSGSGSLTKVGTGTLTLTGSNTYTGLTTISSGGTLQLGDGISGQDGSLASASISNSGSLAYNLFGSPTYAGNITGSGSLINNGSGSLTLTGSNSYAGGTVVNAGMLEVTNTGALPGYSSTGTLTVGSGATLTLSAGTSWTATNIGNLVTANSNGFHPGSALGIDTTLAGTTGFSYGGINGNMGLTVLGTNSLTLTAASSFAGPTTISGGTLQLGDGLGHNGSLNGTGGIIDNSSLAFCNTGSQTYSGNISGVGNLIKNGTNTLTLQGVNAFSGLTTINSGTLQLGNALTLQDSTLNTSGTGSLNFGTLFSCTLGGLTGSGNMSLTNIALTVGGNNASTTYSGTLADLGGTLTKIGLGTLALTGGDNFGHATVNTGMLEVSSTAALPGYNTTGTLTVNKGATLTLHVGGAQEWTATNIGNLVTTNSSGFYTGSTLGLDTTSAAFTYSAISGSMGLTVLGGNTLTLTGSSTYTGPTTISGGRCSLATGPAAKMARSLDRRHHG